jgi:AcrR family transcriptional regulator
MLREAHLNNNQTNGNHDNISTKERIVLCAAELFAVKGFTETSIRDLAKAVGLKGASLYNHFPSKNSILEYILEDYNTKNTAIFEKKDIPAILREKPTSEGILDCMSLSFPESKMDYYLKVLAVLMQEQHRNEVIRRFMADEFFTRTEANVFAVIDALKDLRIIRQDTDPDYWMKACSSLMYSFASRVVLGIGDSRPEFIGKGMAAMLKDTFDMMLDSCAATSEV